MGMDASNVSAIPAVRAFLLEMQRSLARRNSVIMDGRDISTVVLPDADVKVFLTGSAAKNLLLWPIEVAVMAVVFRLVTPVMERYKLIPKQK